MPKSHSHYQDYLDVRSDGRIVLYKRADHQNPDPKAKQKAKAERIEMERVKLLEDVAATVTDDLRS